MPGNRPNINSEALMLRGSLFTFRRRCGKPNCRCASGEPHESPALSYLEAGKAKTLTLTGVDLDEVRSALARYNEAKAELERRADAGVAALRARLGSSRGRQRR